MNKAGWGVAVLAGVVAAGVYVELRRTRVQLDETSQEALRVAEAQAAEIEALQRRIRELSAGASPLDAQPEPLVTESAPASTEPDPVAAIEEPEAKDEERQAEREREERIISAQLGIMMDMAYSPFYEQLGLADESKSAMRDVLVQAAHREQQNARDSMRSMDRKASEIKAFNDETDAWLRQELAQVLSPEKMKEWEEYEPYAEQILFESLLDGQLTMLTPGLSDEARQTTKEQFAKGLKVALDDFHESDEMYTLNNFNDAQLAGLKLGLDELSAELDDGQLNHAGSFITQVEAVFDAMDGGEP